MSYTGGKYVFGDKTGNNGWYPFVPSEHSPDVEVVIDSVQNVPPIDWRAKIDQIAATVEQRGLPDALIDLANWLGGRWVDSGLAALKDLGRTKHLRVHTAPLDIIWQEDRGEPVLLGESERWHHRNFPDRRTVDGVPLEIDVDFAKLLRPHRSIEVHDLQSALRVMVFFQTSSANLEKVTAALSSRVEQHALGCGDWLLVGYHRQNDSWSAIPRHISRH